MLRKNRKLELIKSVPLFAGCSKKELEHIALIADEIDFPSGRDLIREGAPGREFFVLVEGSAEVCRQGRRISSMTDGDFFGELALLTDGPRAATVTTTSSVDVLVINARDFRALVTEQPLIALKVMRAVAERISDDEL